MLRAHTEALQVPRGARPAPRPGCLSPIDLFCCCFPLNTSPFLVRNEEAGVLRRFYCSADSLSPLIGPINPTEQSRWLWHSQAEEARVARALTSPSGSSTPPLAPAGSPALVWLHFPTAGLPRAGFLWQGSASSNCTGLCCWKRGAPEETGRFFCLNAGKYFTRQAAASGRWRWMEQLLGRLQAPFPPSHPTESQNEDLWRSSGGIQTGS